MHAGVLGCAPDATLGEVARIMCTHRVHCVVVSAGDVAERLVWGIVSDTGLMAAAGTPEGVIAGEVAATQVVTVDPSSPLAEAAQLMASTRRATSS
jgi:CBS domain-containing protein